MEEGTEAFHDDVDWSAGMHLGNVFETFEHFQFHVRDRVRAGCRLRSIGHNDVERDLDVGRIVGNDGIQGCLSEECCEGVRDGVPFVGLGLVGYGHVPVAHGSLCLEEVLEVG